MNIPEHTNPNSPAAATLSDQLAQAGPRFMEGRSALVAGGGLGGEAGSIGFSTSWLFARHGARVAVLDRDSAAAQQTVDQIQAAGGEAFAIAGDLTKDEDCERAVEETVARFGRLDAMANSVAHADQDGSFEISPERWDEIMNVNLKTAWQLMRHVGPALASGGSIVNISSAGAHSRGPSMPYGIAKAGLEQLSIGAASTFSSQGVRVNCVRVGAIWSAFAARSMSEELREVRRQNVALQTEGNVWDIASAVLFLSSEWARWISGQVLPVDGGGAAFKPAGIAGPSNTGAAK